MLSFQSAIEEIYWKENTAELAYNLELGWKQYYQGSADTQETINRLEELLKDNVNYELKPWFSLVALLIFIALLLVSNKVKIPQWFIVALGAIFILLLVTYSLLKTVNELQRYEFFFKFGILGILYAVATLRLNKTTEWMKKNIIIFLILIYWYSVSLPNFTIIDRFYMEYPLINQHSVPITLLIEEIDSLDIPKEELPHFVDRFINQRILYREETVDLHMTPIETLRYLKEDCDGIAIVIASILDGFGMDSYMAVNFNHAWVESVTKEGRTVRLSLPSDRILYSQDKNGLRKIHLENFITFYLNKFYTSAIVNSMVVAYYPNKLSLKLLLDYAIIIFIGLMMIASSYILSKFNLYLIFSIFIFYMAAVRIISGLKEVPIKKELKVMKAVITIMTFTLVMIIIPIASLMSFENRNDLNLMIGVPLIMLLYIAVVGYFRQGVIYQIKFLWRVFVKNEEIDYNKEEEEKSFFEEM